MIEVIPPIEKYKYNTWRILPVKCYIDNSVCLRSCIRNINKHFWRRCRGGSQYLLSVYRLHGIILTTIISLTDLSLPCGCLCREVFCRTQVTDSSPLVPEVYVKIYLLTRKFQVMPLTQPAASETHQAKQEILAQPSDGKRMPTSRIGSNVILDKLRNRLSWSALPTVPCILGSFKVHRALYDWGASMNILPKMVYDCLDEDPLVPTPHQLWLADSIMMQPYGIAKDVLIEFQDSSTLVDCMVMDMDPRQ
jgi:hypothetical protein